MQDEKNIFCKVEFTISRKNMKKFAYVKKKVLPLHHENDKRNNKNNDCNINLFGNCLIINLLHSRNICIIDFTYSQLGNNSRLKNRAKIQKFLILTKKNYKIMKTILFFETQIGDSTYTIKTEENKELNTYRTTIEQVDHKGEIIERVCATYKGYKKKALDIAYNEIKNVVS